MTRLAETGFSSGAGVSSRQRGLTFRRAGRSPDLQAARLHGVGQDADVHPVGPVQVGGVVTTFDGSGALRATPLISVHL